MSMPFACWPEYLVCSGGREANQRKDQVRSHSPTVPLFCYSEENARTPTGPPKAVGAPLHLGSRKTEVYYSSAEGTMTEDLTSALQSYDQIDQISRCCLPSYHRIVFRCLTHGQARANP